MEKEELIKKAHNIAKEKKHSPECISGEVGCALVTDKGNVYFGVSIDCSCGIGFCAEHSAIASMVSNGEDKIKIIVAVDTKGDVLPPCGRCRELMLQINIKNTDTDVLIDKYNSEKLSALMPHKWQDAQR